MTGDDSPEIAKPYSRRQARGLEDSAEEGDGRSMFFVRCRLPSMIDDQGERSVLTTLCPLPNDGNTLQLIPTFCCICFPDRAQEHLLWDSSRAPDERRLQLLAKASDGFLGIVYSSTSTAKSEYIYGAR